MRQIEYNTYCKPRPTVVQAQRKLAQTALSELQLTLTRARAPKCSEQKAKYQVRDELLRHSVDVKSAVDASSDETLYDLVSLLDIVLLTAFSEGNEVDGDARGLQLLRNATTVLQQSLAEDDEQDSLGYDRAILVEQIWAWLTNREDAPSPF